MGRYTEDVDYQPGSVNDHSHASHQPGRVSEVGKRSPQNDAAADAALEQARAVLAARNARR